MAMRHTHRIMVRMFKMSRNFARFAPTILVFIHRSRNPAAHAVSQMCMSLDDENHEVWHMLVGERPWCEQLYVDASVPHWIEIGQLVSRLIRPFQVFPWKLGNLVGNEFSQAQKLALAKEVVDLCNHADPFGVEVPSSGRSWPS